MGEFPAALPLRGGPLGFTLAKLISASGSTVVPASDIPSGWQDVLRALTQRPPAWAGLNWDQPAIMAILNVTPDSFSDGGRFATLMAAVEAGLTMARAGADILDVGGESTRPGSMPTSPEIEQSRVIPVIRALAQAGVRVSVDTRNASTMELALHAGAVIVNDISGLSHDPDAVGVVARRGARIVLMHMRGDPMTMNSLASYKNVTVEVATELALRVETVCRMGVEAHSIVIDPGIGFAKTMDHNLELLKSLFLLCNLPHPVLVGVSRKSFIGKITGIASPSERVSGSVTAALHALRQGASILRVHDVNETIQAVRMQKALT